jgi:hypothetical protein
MNYARARDKIVSGPSKPIEAAQQPTYDHCDVNMEIPNDGDTVKTESVKPQVLCYGMPNAWDIIQKNAERNRVKIERELRSKKNKNDVEQYLTSMGCVLNYFISDLIKVRCEYR